MANVIWRPNPGPQIEYLASPAYEVLFGGRRGGGKSETSLADATRYVHHPRFAGIAFRQTYPELEQLIERSHKFYGGIGGSWNGTARTWRFPSGATIKFRHLKDANAYRQYLGHEYQWMLFEELTSFDQHVYSQLKGSCRSTVPGLTPTVRCTTNPGGPGHNWVKTYFVDVAPAGTIYLDPSTGLTRQYIPCPMAPQILEHDPDYVRRLMALPEADRKAWLDGDWDAYTGSVFKFERGVHIWDWSQFKAVTGLDGIPSDWKRYRVMDWGFARPFCVLWIAVDYEGRGYVYREYYGAELNARGEVRPNVGAKLEPSGAAERIKQLEEGETIDQGWTGPDLFSAGTGDTTAGITRYEWFQRQGIHFKPWEAGPDSRKAKKMALHERLAYSRSDDGQIQEWPGIVLIEAPNCIRTIPALEYDPARGGEDVRTDGEDHCYDALSAWCLMRPWKPVDKTPKPKGWRDAKRSDTGWL